MQRRADGVEGARIAIVGGGFTGLTAASRLARDGAQVTVFEAGETVGGLASGCTLLGQPIEKAYHFLYTTDRHALALLEELGMREELTYHKSSVATYYDGVLYPMESAMDLMRFKPLSFIDRIRAGVTVLYLQRVKNWRRLTEIGALDWLRRYAGRQVTEIIWAPLMRGKFDHHHERVTMGWLWGRIRQRVDSRDRTLGGEVLGYVDGGFARLIERLTDHITGSGGQIELTTPVERIVHEPDGDTVSVSAGGETRSFERVLLTTPSNVAGRLLNEYVDTDPDYFEKLAGIDYLGAAVLLFATETPISDFYWHNINVPNSPFVVFLSLTSLIGTERFAGKHVYYIGDYAPDGHPNMSATDGELKERWFDALGEMFTAFRRESVLEAKVFRFRDAQHVVDVDFEDRLVPYRTPCPGVFLCNFSQIFPMDRGVNYAVRDGYRMAGVLRDDLNGDPTAGSRIIKAVD